MKDLSDNTLGELMDLIGRMQGEIEKYLHVSEHLPASITNSIDSYREKLDKELDRRQSGD